MTQFYKISLLILALTVLGLTGYIFFRRAYIWFINWDNHRRLTYWKPVINEWLNSSSQEADDCMYSALSSRDLDIVSGLCMEGIKSHDGMARGKLIQWLDEHGYISQLISQVNSSSRWERARAIESLGLIKNVKAEAVLVAALEDPVFDVRIRAARALGSIGGQKARNALVSALGDEGRWSVIRIADILGQMGPYVVNDLIRAFPNLGSSSRIAALDVIIRLANTSHLQFLLSCLSDKDVEVRTRAVTGLGRIGNATALPRLIYALHDREWPVRAKTAKALGNLGFTHPIPALIDCLSDSDWWVRYSAAEALSKLGEEGTEALINSLSSSDVFCRDQAFSMLQSSGDLTCRLEQIISKSPEAVAKAQNIAVKLIDHLSLQGFIDFCETLPNPNVRAALWMIFQRYSKYSESAA